MPRAKDNRKPVGTEDCLKCGNEAEFFQVQRGRYKGYLYRKGCDCKADQRTLPFVQLEWLEKMKRTPHPMMQHPLTAEPEPVQAKEEPENEPEPKPAEPVAKSGGSGEPETKKSGLIGLGLLVVAGAVAIIT